VQANAQQEREYDNEDVKEEGGGEEGEADGSEEYNPDEEYDPARIADSKPASLASQLSIAPSAAGRRGEKVRSRLGPTISRSGSSGSSNPLCLARG